MEIVIAIVSAILPSLIQQLESQLGYKPTAGDVSGVSAFVAEVSAIIEKYIPSFLRPSVEEIEKLVADLIEKELQKV